MGEQERGDERGEGICWTGIAAICYSVPGTQCLIVYSSLRAFTLSHSSNMHVDEHGSTDC